MLYGRVEHVALGLPSGLATVRDSLGNAGWVRVQLHAERLDWIPGASRRARPPFTIEQPDGLRPLVRAMGNRLIDGAAIEPATAPDATARALADIAARSAELAHVGAGFVVHRTDVSG